MLKLGNSQKYLTYIGIGILLIIAYKIWQKMTSVGGIFDGQKDKLIEEAQLQLDSIDVDLKKCKLTKAQHQQRADALYQGFLGSGIAGLGTDESVIFKALEGTTTEDLKAINREFGIRSNKAFGFIPTFTGDLRGWVLAELSGKDLVKIEKIFEPTRLW